MTTNSSTTHLPLLPSARKKKLLQHFHQSHGSNNNLKGITQSKNGHQQKVEGGRDENGQQQQCEQTGCRDDIVESATLSRTTSSLDSTMKHPLLPLLSLQAQQNPQRATAKSDPYIVSDGIIDDDHHKQLREEQLKIFSTSPPLSASTTTNTVMHFMHTTLKFMNSISAEVGEKLELCENSVEDLEIKLSMVERKLDSIKYVNVVNEKEDDGDKNIIGN